MDPERLVDPLTELSVCEQCWREDRLRRLENDIFDIEASIDVLQACIKNTFPDMRGFRNALDRLEEAKMWLRHETRFDILKRREEEKEARENVC